MIDQVIYLPREAVSAGAIKKVVEKGTACEAGTLQQVIDPLCFLISESGKKNTRQPQMSLEKLKDVMHFKCSHPIGAQ